MHTVCSKNTKSKESIEKGESINFRLLIDDDLQSFFSCLKELFFEGDCVHEYDCYTYTLWINILGHLYWELLSLGN